MSITIDSNQVVSMSLDALESLLRQIQNLKEIRNREVTVIPTIKSFAYPTTNDGQLLHRTKKGNCFYLDPKTKYIYDTDHKFPPYIGDVSTPVVREYGTDKIVVITALDDKVYFNVYESKETSYELLLPLTNVYQSPEGKNVTMLLANEKVIVIRTSDDVFYVKEHDKGKFTSIANNHHFGTDECTYYLAPVPLNSKINVLIKSYSDAVRLILIVEDKSSYSFINLPGCYHEILYQKILPIKSGVILLINNSVMYCNIEGIILITSNVRDIEYHDENSFKINYLDNKSSRCGIDAFKKYYLSTPE
ncbi:Hypothetical protein HVR_LOCUS990 [uncultured virus]|nr:Hypothetical protein HVR_LOCUS990 [uncultured virus]